MGLLDGLLNEALKSVLSGTGGQAAAGKAAAAGSAGGGQLLQAALQMLQQSGGLDGLVKSLAGQGLGKEADSWVGTGENMPVSPGRLEQALGGDVLGQLASRFGMQQKDMSGGLANVLPELVNQLTPQGKIPANANDEIQQALARLTKGFFV
jgi:uncharacterized protein YidB (DUF937 family)